ncbi:ATP-grasp domain-containing protein [Cohnella soli]|uniref:ATP-grasp domain-containing protein n=1 Tax=Cohnella soli TaxID=425005 RepID=A0ABW0HWF6_9BACL
MDLIEQQEQQLLLSAKSTDTILLRHNPDKQFLSYLAKHGFELPNIQIVNNKTLPEDREHRQISLVPYLITEEVDLWTRNTPERSAIGAPYDLVKKLNNKFFTRQMAINHEFRTTVGYFCNDEQELREAYTSLRNAGFEKCVLKIPYGASGKGLKIITNEQEFLTVCKFITRRSHQFDLLLEGWHPTQQCINAQLWIDPTSVKLLAVTEQMIDQNGVYKGTHFTPKFSTSLMEQYRTEVLRLGSILQQKGYFGVCGVDSIVDTNGILYPIIEINARFTQVTYLLPVVAKLINTYSFIFSRYIRFETRSPQAFSNLYEKLHKRLSPDTRNGFMVYTFVRGTLPEQSKTRYRLFVLFYGSDEEKVHNMIKMFIDEHVGVDQL